MKIRTLNRRASFSPHKMTLNLSQLTRICIHGPTEHLPFDFHQCCESIQHWYMVCFFRMFSCKKHICSSWMGHCNGKGMQLILSKQLTAYEYNPAFLFCVLATWLFLVPRKQITPVNTPRKRYRSMFPNSVLQVLHAEK